MQRSLAVSLLALSLSLASIAPSEAEQTAVSLKKPTERPHKTNRNKTASHRPSAKRTTKGQGLPSPVLAPPIAPKTNPIKTRPVVVVPAKKSVRAAALSPRPPRRETVAALTPLQNTTASQSPSSADALLENAVIRFAPIKRDTGRLAPEAEAEQLATPVVQMARAVSHPDPEIPEALLSRPFHGKVILRIRIETDGSHTETLVQGTGDAELDAAILNGVRKWQWEPAIRDGQAISAVNKITLTISNG